MKIRILRTVVLFTIAALLFSGCSLLDFFSSENLLKAPKLTGENAALQQAFEAAAGKDISLFTPISGEFRSSYIKADINNDKIEEALVFYALNNNKTVVHMHILAQENNEWHSIADIAGSGTSVYKVDFFNIDDENNLEIAVTWLVDDSKKARTLSLYKVSGYSNDDENLLTSVATIQLADYIYLDIDSDNINELLYFYYDATGDNEVTTGARLLDYNVKTKNLLPVSDLPLDSGISSFARILYSQADETFQIYVDCINSDGKLSTVIIFYDNTKSVLSLPQVEGSSVSVFTVRDQSLSCQDFDNDGSINIPLQLEYEDSYSVGLSDGVSEQIRYVSWNEFKDGVLYENGKYCINYADRFELQIDDFYEKYYIIYDYIKKETQVRLKSAEENDLVFTIKSNDADVFDSLLTDNKYSQFVISVTPLGESLNITKNYVMDLISDKGWFY